VVKINHTQSTLQSGIGPSLFWGRTMERPKASSEVRRTGVLRWMGMGRVHPPKCGAMGGNCSNFVRKSVQFGAFWRHVLGRAQKILLHRHFLLEGDILPCLPQGSTSLSHSSFCSLVCF